MNHPYKCLFNYYGGKSKLAAKYPVPTHDTVIEPFAGGAAYALRYCDRQVILSDLNKHVIAIWRMMLTLSVDEILKDVPDFVMPGDKVSDFITPDTPEGTIQFMRSCANQATFGDRGTYDKITSFGAHSWHLIRDRIEYWHPKIQHWDIRHQSYEELPDIRATWFVDPPYSGGLLRNQKGSDYLHWQVDYPKLADWVRSRQGQRIVCEQAGADWLPFEAISEMHGPTVNGKTTYMEAAYILEGD